MASEILHLDNVKENNVLHLRLKYLGTISSEKLSGSMTLKARPLEHQRMPEPGLSNSCTDIT
jgi:hypothetical protein